MIKEIKLIPQDNPNKCLFNNNKIYNITYNNNKLNNLLVFYNKISLTNYNN